MTAASCAEEFAGLEEALARTPAAAKYTLVRPLSRGAFGSVVLAVQAGSSEQCAIKAMRIGCAAGRGTFMCTQPTQRATARATRAAAGGLVRFSSTDNSTP